MGTMLILKNESREYIGKDAHFSDLVREELGDDAADWFDDRIYDADLMVSDALDESEEKRRYIESFVTERLIPALVKAPYDDLDILANEWKLRFKQEMEDTYG